MADKNYNFPFESGKLYGIMKITKKSFSVCMLYDMIARKMHKYCTNSTLFNPRNIFISQGIYEKLFNYYLGWGYTDEEVTHKLSILGPKVNEQLVGNEVAFSKTCMYGEASFAGKGERCYDDYE